MIGTNAAKAVVPTIVATATVAATTALYKRSRSDGRTATHYHPNLLNHPISPVQIEIKPYRPEPSFEDQIPAPLETPISKGMSAKEKAAFKEGFRALQELGVETGRVMIAGGTGLAIVHPLTRLMLVTAGKTPFLEASKIIFKHPFKDLSLSIAPAPLQYFGIVTGPAVITMALKKLTEDSEGNYPETPIKLAAVAAGGTWETIRSGGTNASMLLGQSIDKKQLLKDSLNPFKIPGRSLSTIQTITHATRNMASTFALSEGVKITSEHVTKPLFTHSNIPHTKEDGKTLTTSALVLSATVASIAASIASSPSNQLFCMKTESPEKGLLTISKEILSNPNKMALAAIVRTLRTGPLVGIIIFLCEKSKEHVPNPYSPPPKEAEKQLKTK